MFGFLKISGNHAKSFLQGQLTCDVNEVNEEESCLGAHCNLKGRVLFNFRLSLEDNHYFLKLPLLMLQTAKTRLLKFAVFSQVSIEIDPRIEKTGLLEKNLVDEIKKGFATIYPETSGLFTPHELNFQHWHLISFTKGCYTGQEVVARMEYLGKLKKHLRLASFSSKETPSRAHHCFNENLEQETGVLVDWIKTENERYLLLILLDDSAENTHNYYCFDQTDAPIKLNFESFSGSS